jgi:SAM-dependent methyltransferase
MDLDTRKYWNERAKRHLDLEGVGCEGRTKIYNQYLYKSKIRAIGKVLNKIKVDFENVDLLDIGTGTGFWVEYFLNKEVSSIVGVDISSLAIENLQKNYGKDNLRFICGDVGNSDFNMNKDFSLIVAMDVLYHIVDNKKFETAIRNISCSLRPGGYFIFSDIMSNTNDEMRPQPHVCFRNIKQYNEQLENLGIDIIEISPMYFLLHPPLDIKNKVVGELLHIFYYNVTLPLTRNPPILPSTVENLYLNSLYKLDSLFTSMPKFGITTKIAIARKRIH